MSKTHIDVPLQKRSLTQLFSNTHKIEISSEFINNIQNLNFSKTMWTKRNFVLANNAIDNTINNTVDNTINNTVNTVNNAYLPALSNLVISKAVQLQKKNGSSVAEYLEQVFVFLEKDSDFNFILNRFLSLFNSSHNIDSNLLIRDLLVNTVLYIMLVYISCNDYSSYKINNCELIFATFNGNCLKKSYIVDKVGTFLDQFIEIIPFIIRFQHSYDTLDEYHFRFLEEKHNYVADINKIDKNNALYKNLDIAISHYDYRIIEVINQKKYIHCLVLDKIKNLFLQINFF